jgi:hypothetical protein
VANRLIAASDRSDDEPHDKLLPIAFAEERSRAEQALLAAELPICLAYEQPLCCAVIGEIRHPTIASAGQFRSSSWDWRQTQFAGAGDDG